MSLYAGLAEVRFDRLFREAGAIVEAFAVGEPKARALFGPDVQYGGPAWAGISYGHVNCLGAPLVFPPDSEVSFKPIYGSLDEGIEALQHKTDWASAGQMPFYLDLWEALKTSFPDRNIPFGGFGYEGPITTAWELRGHDFFLDVHDDPPRCREYMHLVTRSIVGYAAFVRALNGQPAFVDTRIGLYDDVASLIHPAMWPDMVLPYQEQFFCSQTSGPRHAHIENLTPAHLPHLDTLDLDSFDPSVVTQIQPSDLRDRCHIPFTWRLNSMQVRDFSRSQVRRFVFESVADGASGVFCAIARTMTGPEQVAKVHTFIEAARQVATLLGNGCPRRELRQYLGL
jgi:hypothetical protein